MGRVARGWTPRFRTIHQPSKGGAQKKISSNFFRVSLDGAGERNAERYAKVHPVAPCNRRHILPSTAGRALRVHVERIERMARRHEQPVASDAAEAEVGAALGQRNEADRLAGGIENLDPVLLGGTHAPATPEIALDVAAEAVGRAARFSSDEGAAIGELVVVDVIDLDHAWDHTRFDDVEFLFIGRKGKPVRSIDIARR